MSAALEAALALALALGLALAALLRPDIPWAELEARYATPASRYLDLPDGVRLHYRDEGRTDGPPLVLVHGFAASAADWDAWAERLGSRFRVIALDLPGHGLTRTPPGYHASIDGYAAIVGEVIGRLGLQRPILAGNSMGGAVAWRYALDHGAALRGLVLVDAAGWPEPRQGGGGAILFALMRAPPARALLTRLDLRPLARQGLRAAFVDPRLVDAALVDRYVDLARAPGHRAVLIDIGRAPDDEASPERLAALRTPTLVMVGDQDRLIPPADGGRFQAAIPGAELVTFKGVGHVPMEQAPGPSAAALLAFADRTP